MLKNLRFGWRQFAADPGYTAVVVGGLAVAVACCFLVAQIVFNEVLPDPEVPDAGQVVRLEFHQDIWRPQAPYPFAGELRRSHAPVTAVARSLDGSSSLVHAGERSAQLGIEYGDPELVDIFGLRASAGDLRAALREPDAIALTEDSARKLFPDGRALGRTVVMRGHALRVVALVPARPRLFDGCADAFVSFDSPASNVIAAARNDWNWSEGDVFARVAPGFRPADVGAAAQALYERSASPASRLALDRKLQRRDDVRAIALTRQYLDGANGASHRNLLLGVAGGAALMLVLAIANYINLTSVRTLARAREIAVRKTLGANPWLLTLQFVVESMLAVVASAAIGLRLAWWLAPTVGELLRLHLARGLFVPGHLALLAAGALALGACTGLYPARIALGVNCIAALTGRSHDEGAAGRAARRAMTALQFGVALVIAGAAGAILWQNRFIASLDPGIRTQGLLAVDLPDAYRGQSQATGMAFRDALSHEPGVQALAWSLDVPGRSEDKQFQTVGRGPQGPTVNANVMPVDLDFFAVYGVHILAGHPRAAPPPAAASGAASAPKQERPVVLDASTARRFGFPSPQSAVDQVLLYGGEYSSVGQDRMRIVAVASDIRLEDARDAARAHVFALSSRPQPVLTLKGPDMDKLQQAVTRVASRIYPDNPAEMMSVAEAIALPYESEHNFARVAAGTTIIALLLSAFGVYALAAYTVRRSAREIVVRKLYGAGRGRIARLVAREFAPLIAAAAVVGLPLAGWLARAWLENFTKRSPSILWVLPAALLALLATTALAALRHARLAMAMRPAQALRD